MWTRYPEVASMTASSISDANAYINLSVFLTDTEIFNFIFHTKD